jgi:transcriptional regulator
MAAPGIFDPPSAAAVTRLVQEYPFAWLVSSGAGDFMATPLPLRPETDADGRIIALLGHFARSNPQVELLRRQPRTLVLFMGPHGYISSSWFEDRTRTPTWNYATVQYLVDLQFIDDHEGTEAVMRDLIDTMEAGRPDAWSMEETGPRLERLVTGIVAFRAAVVELRAKFKLGQDERDSEHRDITKALRAAGGGELLTWMERCATRRC